MNFCKACGGKLGMLSSKELDGMLFCSQCAKSYKKLTEEVRKLGLNRARAKEVLEKAHGDFTKTTVLLNEILAEQEIGARKQKPVLIKRASQSILDAIGREIVDKLATDAPDDFIARDMVTQLDNHGEIVIFDFSIDGLELVREKKGFLDWQGEFEERRLDATWYKRPTEERIWLNLQRISLIAIYAALASDPLVQLVRTRARKLIGGHSLYLFSVETTREQAKRFSRERGNFWDDPARLRGWRYVTSSGQAVTSEEVLSSFDVRLASLQTFEPIVPHGDFLSYEPQHESSHTMRKLRLIASEGGKAFDEAAAEFPQGEVPDSVRKFRLALSEYERRSDQIGVATALAITPDGAAPISIEAVTMAGRGIVEVTGEMSEAMRSCGRVAWTCLRTQASAFGIDPTIFQSTDAHIHIPGNWLPKDGPSAGLAMAVAVSSALTGHSVNAAIGITGEISLNGDVLPVGGVAYKVLGAFVAGLNKVIVPQENKESLKAIPPCVCDDIALLFVSNVREAAAAALSKA